VIAKAGFLMDFICWIPSVIAHPTVSRHS